MKISNALHVMNVSHAAVNLSFIIVQTPLCIFSGLLIMSCDSVVDDSFENLYQAFLSALYLIFTVHLMAFVVLSCFVYNDSNRATQFGFLLLLLSIIPFEWYLTYCSENFVRGEEDHLRNWCSFCFGMLPNIPPTSLLFLEGYFPNREKAI